MDNVSSPQGNYLKLYLDTVKSLMGNDLLNIEESITLMLRHYDNNESTQFVHNEKSRDQPSH